MVTTIEQRLRTLGSKNPGSVAAILSACLPHACAEEVEPIVACLLQTKLPQSVAAIIRHLHRLSPLATDLLLATEVPASAAYGHLVPISDAQTASNVIEFARYRGDAQLLLPLVQLLGSSLEGIPGRAARGLLALIVTHAGDHGTAPLTDESAFLIDQAVATAAETWREHRQPEILLAMAVLTAAPGPKLNAILQQPDHPAVLAMRAVPGWVEHRLVRTNLLRWLTVDALARQASRWIHAIRSPEAWADLLSQGSLLEDPETRRALRSVDRPQQALPDLAAAVQLPDACQAHLASYVAGLRLPVEIKAQRLAEFIALPCASARLHALEALMGLRTPAAETAIERFCFDAEEAIALTAAAHCLERSERPSDALLERLALCGHPSIAGIATRTLAQQCTTDECNPPDINVHLHQRRDEDKPLATPWRMSA